MGQDLLNWQRIYDWAGQQPAHSIVGESCTNTLCPLARYLNEQTGYGDWSVGIAIKRGDQRLDKPNWVQYVIDRVDEETNETRGPVTREQFISVLNELKEEIYE